MACCKSSFFYENKDVYPDFEDVEYIDYSTFFTTLKCPKVSFLNGDVANMPLTALQKILEATCGNEVSITKSNSHKDIDAFIEDLIRSKSIQDAFYVLDLAAIVKLFRDWAALLPRVRPFYAVKCNPSLPLLSTMAALGAGFDCASKSELELVLSIGVSPQRIVYANPCKMISHIAYASSVGINLTTYDSENEVLKVRSNNPNAKLLLRLRADDLSSKWPLGVKYGALMTEVEQLLAVASNAKVHVVGVSFHIGSGASDARSYLTAIAAARKVFDMALSLGLPAMQILDIGGGFTVGNNGELKLAEAATVINAALDEYFPEEMGVSIIAEPGRYFAEIPTTLAAMIYGKRVRGEVREYWINDGIYGTMNCLIHDYAVLCPRPLACISSRKNTLCGGQPVFKSTVFGPTCDSLDTVLKDHPLPDLVDGDWLVFPNMGAYTHCAGSRFNGYDISAIPTFCIFSLNNSPVSEALGTFNVSLEGPCELNDKLSCSDAASTVSEDSTSGEDSE